MCPMLLYVTSQELPNSSSPWTSEESFERGYNKKKRPSAQKTDDLDCSTAKPPCPYSARK